MISNEDASGLTPSEFRAKYGGRGLAQGRVNPERDAAREEKRERRAGRGTVSKDVEFHVFHDGAEWVVTELTGKLVVLSRGQSPTSAIIGAEIALFKRAR